MAVNTKAMIALAEIIGTIHAEYGPKMDEIKKSDFSSVNLATERGYVAEINDLFVKMVKDRNDIKIETNYKDENGNPCIGNDALDRMVVTNIVGRCIGGREAGADVGEVFELFLYMTRGYYKFTIE